MTHKALILWTIPRTSTFWLTGLMNTVFLRPGDIGTWKNYVGYFLLMLALIDTIFLITVMLRKSDYEKVKYSFLKVLALMIPFYFVYFPQLQEDSDNPKVKSLLKYILIGFSIYILSFVIFYLLK